MSTETLPAPTNPEGEEKFTDYEALFQEARPRPNPPFKHELKEFDAQKQLMLADALYEVEGRPDLFIRQLPNIETTEELKQNKLRFDHMRQAGIRVVEYSVVLGHKPEQDPDPAEAAQYVVAQKVNGESLGKLHRDEVAKDPNLEESIAKLAKSLPRYIAQCAQNGDPLAEDIDEFQFIYGTTAKDAKPDLYMVDLDPIFAEKFNITANQTIAIEGIANTLLKLHELSPQTEEIWHAFMESVDLYCQNNIDEASRNKLMKSLQNR